MYTQELQLARQALWLHKRLSTLFLRETFGTTHSQRLMRTMARARQRFERRMEVCPLQLF